MPSQQSRKYDVFLSHHNSDKPYVETLATRLEDEAGVKPFLDKWHLVPGAPWQEELEEALSNSATCAVFLGPAGLGPWQNEEMRAVLDERVRNNSFRVIPVLLPGAEPKDEDTLPRFLRRLTWVDFRKGLDEQESFNCLVAGIRGEQPGRQSFSNSTQNKTVQWVLILSGTIDDIDKPRAEALAAHLRELSGDLHLTIQKIERGSVKLFIESSQEGLESIMTAFERGQFRDALGIEVLDIKLSSDLDTIEPVVSIIDDVYKDPPKVLKPSPMATASPGEITQSLRAWSDGDQTALNELTPLVYEELRRLAHAYLRRERPDPTLQTTALINEAYLKLIDLTESKNLIWDNRAHFFAISSQLMRTILVDIERQRNSQRRGGGQVQIPLDAVIEEQQAVIKEQRTDLLALDEALDRLAELSPRASQVVELRFFGGLSIDETAGVLEVSQAVVKREWRVAKAWLQHELTKGTEG